MAPGLLERLDARFLFVVGKGGVGKTTTAGALALASADADASTHLLSTDPAHSVGDLFEVTLEPGRPTPSPCTSRLVLEELDAAAYAAAWIAHARAPLLELFDRGTYLDAADVEGFLDLSLPGVDEVAAVLRLAELAERPEPARIVIDTAPTGHTLRLLEASAVIEGWAGAFDAMEEKAAAVVSGLMRRSIRFAGRAVIRDLEAKVARFRAQVLAAGAAIVVERPGVLIEAESRRLRAGLAERGLRVGARVLTAAEKEATPGLDADADEPTPLVIPWRPGMAGCGALRRWGEPAGSTTAGQAEAAASAGATPASGAAFLRTLDVELLLFVGKGGVGKTTCAAAAAVGIAAHRPVVLLGTDPAGSLADVLGVPIPRAGAEIDSVRVREVESGTDFADFRDRYRADVEAAFQRLGVADGLALDRRVVSSLLDLAPPGADELFAILALLEEAGRDALLVVDAAPTGHLLRLLEMPELALAWTRQLMRVLLKYRAALGLDAFAERLLDFAKQLKDLNLRLHDPTRTAAVVVTLAGPLVAAETARLESRLHTGGVRVAAVLLNQATANPEHGAGRAAPRVVAPLIRPSPIGPTALGAFFRSWTVT